MTIWYRIFSFLSIFIVLFLISDQVKAQADFKIFVNGDEVSFSEPVYLENDRIYVPIRFLSESIGANVHWNNDNRQVKIATPFGDILTFTIDSKEMKLNQKTYAMDVKPFIRHGRTYLPIRHVAEFMHTTAEWENDLNRAIVKTVPMYYVDEGETLYSISEKFNTNVELLKERNNLLSNEIAAGMMLKVVIPEILKNQPNNSNDPNVILLARLIEAEAEAEPLTGKIAVGSVIMNRIKDPRFPNTIQGVIFQEGQFTPVKTGKINNVTPSEDSIRAAKEAINGAAPVGNALFFYNPSKTKNTFLTSRSTIKDIGQHRFAY